VKYLPRKLIKEEINKINPKLDFSVSLSSNRWGMYDDKSYIIKIKLFCWIYPIVIKREVIKRAKIKEFREIIRSDLTWIEKQFKKRFPIKPYNEKELKKRHRDLIKRKKNKDMMDWEVIELEVIDEYVKKHGYEPEIK